MGNCCGHRPESTTTGYRAGTAENNLSGRADTQSNSRLLRSEGNSTSRGHSRFFGPSSSNTYTTSNTSTSVLRSENSQTSQVIGHEEFLEGQILDAANLKVFSLAELKTATRNFRADAVVGEGGFGRVYKGSIKETTGSNKVGEVVIAVKRMNSDSRQGMEEWLSEVNFLGRLSHPNLVKLFGFARENGELILVYEFMHKGSLANQLFGRGAKIRPLSWGTRLKVMIGAARGLCFLHSLEKKVIYRDFKPSNILLDRSYNAKLADFGLAKDGPSGDRTHVTTQVVGTCGYAAPEYIATGHLSVKSDVYGFGVVLVEILTGKSIRDITQQWQQSLVDWLKSNLLRSGKMRGAMDPGLDGKYPPKLASQVAKLALNCIRHENKLRPSMTEVVETLEQIETANIEKSSDSRKQGTHSKAAQLHGQPDGG